MPLGAIVAREAIMTSWELGAHGSTYGGNPLSCAAALATIELIEGGLMDNARDVGNVLLEGLRGIKERYPSLLVDVRGLALMIGIEFPGHDEMVAVEQAAFRRGLLALGCGENAIRMSPPLLLREDQAKTALDVFEEAVAEVAG